MLETQAQPGPNARMSALPDATEQPSPDISFIVIGYNEARNLAACLESVRRCYLPRTSYELIYVDGGSTDGSVGIADGVGVDLVLGGERRRRAAENRNLGAKSARGRYLQFVDGDMALDSDWPAAAVGFLDLHPEVAVAYGNLKETDARLLFRVMQLDWNPQEGPVATCGGAAMFRREAFEAAGGFPEDVRYGEEPLLCWRIRNEQKRQVYHLNRPMALHDIGFRRIEDYWRQYVRHGETYAEIAARCAGTDDPMWVRERTANFGWAGLMLLAVVALA
ncbi:MAG: glycosyltransferase, partial [Candidatus Hydrogenedentales bacterium]